MDEIRHLILSENIHILCLNETRLDNTITNDEIAIIHYTVIRNDRNRNGGGVAIYISNHISFSVLDDLLTPCLEILWLEIKLSNKKSFILGSCCNFIFYWIQHTGYFTLDFLV